MNAKTKGAVNDLTVAIEFLTTALREIVRCEEVSAAEVQTYLDYANRKIRPLLNVPQ